MPLLADRVRETTTTTGQGTLTLAGAVTGFRTFSGAFGNGVSVYYVIAGGAEWEIGFGTTGAGTLSRDTVLVSSAGGTTKVTFSAGTKDVFCSYVADRAVTTSDAATLTNKTIDDYTNNVGANSTHFRIKAGATLAKGDVIKASGFTPGENAIEVVKVASSTDVALGIVEQALSTGQFGTAVVIGELFDVNTNGLAVGATLYSNGSGGFTTTRPASGLFQALGWVVRANLNNGVIAVNVVNPQYVDATAATADTLALRDGSGNVAAVAMTMQRLAASGQSLTGSQATSLVDLAATWNTTGTPTALKLNVTDTASNAASLLLDLQVGGSSRFYVDKSGSTVMQGTYLALKTSGLWMETGASVSWFRFGSPSGTLIVGWGNSGVQFGSTQEVGWSSGNPYQGTFDLRLVRDAADTLAQRRTTSAQTFRLYNTFTDASNYERGKFEWASNVLRIGTEKLGTGTARALELQTDGTTRVTIAATSSTVTFSVWEPLAGLGGYGLSYGGGSLANGITNANGGAQNFLLPVTSQSPIELRSGSGLAWSSSTIGQALDLFLLRDAAQTLAQRNGTNAQTFNIYNTYTSATNYERLSIAATAAGAVRIRTNKGSGGGTSRALELGTDDTTRVTIPTTGGCVVGTAALATNATDGFLYVPTCAGTPTGTPTAQTGTVPIVVDTTNNKLYFYSGAAWRDAGP